MEWNGFNIWPKGGNYAFEITIPPQLALSIVFSGLSSAQTGAHVYRGGPTENGPITYTFPLGSPLNTTWGTIKTLFR